MTFTARNWLKISTLFVLGSAFHCESCVFKDRSANMAALMALLIDHSSVSAFLNFLNCLVGVIIGKALPGLIFSFMDPRNNVRFFDFFGCNAPTGTITIAFVVFVFEWFFNYMHYTSKSFGPIGCFAAAFGASGLIVRCGGDDTTNASKYVEMAQYVFAIFLALAVDEVFDLILEKPARDAAVQNVKMIKEDFEAGFGAFFDKDMAKMKESLAKVKETICSAQADADDADPGLAMVPGFRSEFRFDLYKQALELCHLLHSDLAMLLLSLTEWVRDLPPKDGNDFSALKTREELSGPKATGSAFDLVEYLSSLHSISCKGGIKMQLLDSMATVFGALQNLLAPDIARGAFEDAEMTQEMTTMSLNGAQFRKHDALYKEINSKPFALRNTDMQITQDERVKVSVSCRALENAQHHLNEIQILLAK